MAWLPVPFTVSLKAWMLGQMNNKTGSFSFKPFAEQIGIDYELASIAAMTSFGSLPLIKGTAAGIQKGFEDSFQAAQDWGIANITSDDYTVKNWYNDMPLTVWLPAAQGVVDYWAGGTMLPTPPPPGGAVGPTNVILIPGTPTPLNKDISDAFKTQNINDVVNGLNDSFVNHLKLVTGVWTGVTPSVPPLPLIFPWVGLS